MPVEVKENFAIVNSKYGSLAEASTHFHVEITSIKYILLVRHLGFVCVLLHIACSGLLQYQLTLEDSKNNSSASRIYEVRHF